MKYFFTAIREELFFKQIGTQDNSLAFQNKTIKICSTTWTEQLYFMFANKLSNNGELLSYKTLNIYKFFGKLKSQFVL